MARVFISARGRRRSAEVLEQAQRRCSTEWLGMSVMEMSHRGKDYCRSRRRPRPTCGPCCDPGHLQGALPAGGASQQFSMIR